MFKNWTTATSQELGLDHSYSQLKKDLSMCNLFSLSYAKVNLIWFTKKSNMHFLVSLQNVEKLEKNEQVPLAMRLRF